MGISLTAGENFCLVPDRVPADDRPGCVRISVVSQRLDASLQRDGWSKYVRTMELIYCTGACSSSFDDGSRIDKLIAIRREQTIEISVKYDVEAREKQEGDRTNVT